MRNEKVILGAIALLFLCTPILPMPCLSVPVAIIAIGYYIIHEEYKKATGIGCAFVILSLISSAVIVSIIMLQN